MVYITHKKSANSGVVYLLLYLNTVRRACCVLKRTIQKLRHCSRTVPFSCAYQRPKNGQLKSQVTQDPHLQIKDYGCSIVHVICQAESKKIHVKFPFNMFQHICMYLSIYLSIDRQIDRQIDRYIFIYIYTLHKIHAWIDAIAGPSS